jgi:hypothetical protein
MHDIVTLCTYKVMFCTMKCDDTFKYFVYEKEYFIGLHLLLFDKGKLKVGLFFFLSEHCFFFHENISLTCFTPFVSMICDTF